MDFFGPQGPSSIETQGLLTSIIFSAQEKAKKKISTTNRIFFMFLGKFLLTKSEKKVSACLNFSISKIL
jgi:hypothetical protein